MTIELSAEEINAAFENRESRRDFATFYEKVGRDRRGKPIKLTNVLRIIHDTASTSWEIDRNLSVVAPPGQGKSTFLRIFSLHLLGNHHNNNFAYISATEATAKNNVAFCRSILAAKPHHGGLNEYRSIFPNIVPDFEGDIRASRGWRQSNFFIKREGQASDPVFSAFPAVMTAESIRVDYAFFDDAMTREVASSPVKRNKVIDAVKRTWLDGRLVDGDKRGHAIFIQNCWNQDDLAHVFRYGDRLSKLARSGPRADITSLWIGVNETNTAYNVALVNAADHHPLKLHPEEYNATQIDEENWQIPFEENSKLFNKATLDEKEESDPPGFNRAFRLRATADDDLMFPHWKKRARTSQTVAELLDMPTDDLGRIYIPRDRLGEVTFAAGYDISSQKRKGNWLCISAKLPDTRRVIVELHRGNWTPTDTVSIIAECYHRIPFNVLHVENNGVQDQIIEAYRALPEAAKFIHTIRPFTTGSNKHSEEIGLPGMDIMLANGTYVFCEPSFKQGYPTYQEHGEYGIAMATTERFLLPGKTPDSVMAWWFADRGLSFFEVKGSDFSFVGNNETDMLLHESYADGDMESIFHDR